MRGHRSAASSGRRRRGPWGPLGDVLIAPRPGGSIALCLRKGVYLDLDGSATEIVELVKIKGTDGAVTALAERHGLTREVSSGHVDNVLRTFASVGPGAATRARPLTPAGGLRVVRQWAAFPTRLRVSTAYATCLMTVVEALVRLCPVDQAARWLGAPLVTHDTGELPPLDRDLLTERELLMLGSLSWAQRLWPWDATCLRRALAAGWLLRRRRPGLCLGLPSTAGALAHAWLVVGGRALDALPDTVPLLPVEATKLGRD